MNHFFDLSAIKLFLPKAGLVVSGIFTDLKVLLSGCGITLLFVTDSNVKLFAAILGALTVLVALVGKISDVFHKFKNDPELAELKVEEKKLELEDKKIEIEERRLALILKTHEINKLQKTNLDIVSKIKK